MFQEFNGYNSSLHDAQKWLLQISYQLMGQNAQYISNREQTAAQIERHQVSSGWPSPIPDPSPQAVCPLSPCPSPLSRPLSPDCPSLVPHTPVDVEPTAYSATSNRDVGIARGFDVRCTTFLSDEPCTFAHNYCCYYFLCHV